MGTRILSAIVGAGIFLGCCFAGPLPFAVAVTVIAAIGLWEWVRAYRNAKDASPTPVQPLIAACGIVFPLLAYSIIGKSHGAGTIGYAALLAACVAFFGLRVFYANRTGTALGPLRSHYGLVGMVYIGLLCSSFALLRNAPKQLSAPPFGFGDRGAWLFLFVAVCVWATDTFAYFAGRSLGRHKLAPKLSPAKTVEGFIGGLLGAMAAGVAFAASIHLPPLLGLAVGGMAGVVGPLGDLFESALKREIGLKDFGNIMPGHGGILDRFDSLLFVAPLAYLLLQLTEG